MSKIKQSAANLDQHLDDTDRNFTAVGYTKDKLIIYSPKPSELKLAFTQWQGYPVEVVKMERPKPAAVGSV